MRTWLGVTVTVRELGCLKPTSLHHIHRGLSEIPGEVVVRIKIERGGGVMIVLRMPVVAIGGDPGPRFSGWGGRRPDDVLPADFSLCNANTSCFVWRAKGVLSEGVEDDGGWRVKGWWVEGEGV